MCLEDADYKAAAAAQASIAALMNAKPCSQRATSPIASSATSARHADAKRVVEEKERKRRAELLRAQEHLDKCLEEKDYKEAAAAQKEIDALVCAVSSKADSSAATATGQETQLATDQAHSSAPSVTGQGLQRVTRPEATSVSYTHLRAHETKANLVCRLLLEKKN